VVTLGVGTGRRPGPGRASQVSCLGRGKQHVKGEPGDATCTIG
jgi:hypothetical protein